jgi:membrane protein
MNLETIRQGLEHLVWDTDLDPSKESRGRAILIEWSRIVVVVARDVLHGQLRLQAMSLVYTSLLALGPLLAVVFAVLKAFGVHTLLRPTLLSFLAPLEERGVELTNQILQFVSNMRVGVLGAVGLGLLLYTSTSLVRKVEQAFNSIWHVHRGRRLMRRLSDYLAVIVIGPLLFFTALGVTASLASSGWLQPFHGFVTVIAKTVPYLLVIGGYVLVYVFIPNTKVRIRSALLGAAVAGVLWQSAGFAFAAFVAGSGQYRAVYASLAILILFIIWMYLSWLILLIGAAIAHYHQHPERVTREPHQVSVLISNRRRERLGLLIARLIAEHYYTGQAAWNAEALARRLRCPLPVTEQLLAAFSVNGMLARTHHTPVAYLPACALETVPLSKLIAIIRASGIDRGPQTPDPIVDDIMEKTAQAGADALAGRTWRDLFVADEGTDRDRTEIHRADARNENSAGA